MANAANSRFLRLAREGSWILIGQCSVVGGALVLVHVLTRYLDPARYGQLSLGLTAAGLANQIVLGGVSAAVARYHSIATEKGAVGTYLHDSIRLFAGASLLVIAIGVVLTAVLREMGETSWASLVAAAMTFSVLSGIGGALGGIQNAARQRASAAIHGGVDAWLKILLVIAILQWLGPSAVAVVIGYACSSALVAASQAASLHRSISTQDRRSTGAQQFLPQMLAFSWPFSAWGLFTWLQQASDRWALAAFATPTDVGLYAVLFQLGYAPIAVLTTMSMTFLAPILYQRSGDATDQARNTGVHHIVWRITGASIATTVFAFGAALLVHGPLFHVLVAAEYRQALGWLPWVVMAGGLYAAGQMLALKLLSEMKSARMAAAKIGSSIAGVCFNVAELLGGLVGVVAAQVAFAAVYLAWMVALAARAPVLPEPGRLQPQ